MSKKILFFKNFKVIIFVTIFSIISCTPYIPKNNANLIKGKQTNIAPSIDFLLSGNSVPTIYGETDFSVSIVDDGLPNPPGKLTIKWEQVQGTEKLNIETKKEGRTIHISFIPPDLNQKISTPIFSINENSKYGEYAVKVMADDGALKSSKILKFKYKKHGNEPNTAPQVTIVSAKTNIKISETLFLQSSVIDDGLPQGNSLLYSWSKKSGPGDIYFKTSNETTSYVSFEKTGKYEIELTVSDGELEGKDTISIDVSSELNPNNQAPEVKAGPGGNTELAKNFALEGSVTDDGNPTPSKLTIQWSKSEGPGTVGFSDANSSKTEASFSEIGTYKLKLWASDGELSSADFVTVEVLKNNTNPGPAPGKSVADLLIYNGVMQSTYMNRWAQLFHLSGDNGIVELVDTYYKAIIDFLAKYYDEQTIMPTYNIVGCDQEFETKKALYEQKTQKEYKRSYQFEFQEIKNINYLRGLIRNRKNAGYDIRLEWVENSNKTDVVEQRYDNVAAYGGKIFGFGFLLEILDLLMTHKGADPVVQNFLHFMIEASWQWATIISEAKWEPIRETHYNKTFVVSWKEIENRNEHHFEISGEGMPSAIQLTTPAERKDPKNLYKLWVPHNYIGCGKYKNPKTSEPEWILIDWKEGGDSDTGRHLMTTIASIAQTATYKHLGAYDDNLKKKMLFLLQGIPEGNGKYYSGLAKKILSTNVDGLLNVSDWVHYQFTIEMGKHFFRTLNDLIFIVKYLKDIPASESNLSQRARTTLIEILQETKKYKFPFRQGLEGTRFEYPYIPVNPVNHPFKKWPGSAATGANPEPRRFIITGGFWDWSWMFSLLFILEELDENNPQEKPLLDYLKDNIRKYALTIQKRKYSPLAYEWTEGANGTTIKTPLMTNTLNNEKQAQLQIATFRGGYLGHWSEQDLGKVLLRRHYGSQSHPVTGEPITEGPRNTGGGLWPHEYYDKIWLADENIGKNFIDEYFLRRSKNTTVTPLIPMEEINPYMAGNLLTYPEDHEKAGQLVYTDKYGMELARESGGKVVYLGSNTPCYNDKGNLYYGLSTTPRGNEGIPEITLLIKALMDKDETALHTWFFINACRLLPVSNQLIVYNLESFDNLHIRANHLLGSPMDWRTEWYKTSLLRALFDKTGGGHFGEALKIIFEKNNK